MGAARTARAVACSYTAPHLRHSSMATRYCCAACKTFETPLNCAQCNDRAVFRLALSPLQVCTGSSRVGTGCYDDMGTGMCASMLEADCEDACRANPRCELFVYYPHERKGTCVLCSDLFSSDHTPEAATRAYAVGAASKPPAPPGMQAAAAKHFSVVAEPSPPQPPKISPPPKISHLGRHKTDQSKAHVDCQFYEGVELTTSRQTGYSDRSASTKEECCNECGRLESGCANFIYEPSTGVCVLLPLTPASELERDDNEFVISGQASVGPVASGATTFPTSSCAFIPDSGYSGRSNGAAPRLPGGEMQTREECCQACGVTPGCSRFTFSDASKACTMYPAYAEIVMVNDLTSGSIPSKLAGASAAVPPVAGGGEAPAFVDDTVPPAPSMPSFAKLVMLPPPPPPDKEGDASELFKGVMSDVSIVAGSAMIFGLLFCMYCLFSPTIIGVINSVKEGKASRGRSRSSSHGGRHHKLPQRAPRMEDDDEDDEDDDEDDDGEALIGRRLKKAKTAIVPVEPRRKPRRASERASAGTGRKNGRGRSRVQSEDEDDDDDEEEDDERGRERGSSGRRSRAPPPEPTARLMVQTVAISQSRNLVVTHCRDYEALRDIFFEEFYSALKGVRPGQTLLFCLAPPPGESTTRQRRRGRHEDPEEQLMWLLVTKHSDFSKVIACPAFRLQDERCDADADPDEYVVAFEKESKSNRRQKQRKQEEQRRQPLMLEMVPVAVEPSPDREAGRASRRSSRRASPLRRSSSRASSREPTAERDGGRRSRRASPPRERTPSPPRERSRDRRRGYASAPPRCVGVSSRGSRSSRSGRRGGGDRGSGSGSGSGSGDEDIRSDGGSSSGGENTASSRRLLRGGGGRSGNGGGKGFVPLTSSALEQLPDVPARPSSRAATPSIVSVWDDDDPDGTGRSSKMRGTSKVMAELE